MNSGSWLVDFEGSANMISEAEVLDSVDMGHSTMYRLKHPSLGDIVLVSSVMGSGAVMKL